MGVGAVRLTEGRLVWLLDIKHPSLGSRVWCTHGFPVTHSRSGMGMMSYPIAGIGMGQVQLFPVGCGFGNAKTVGTLPVAMVSPLDRRRGLHDQELRWMIVEHKTGGLVNNLAIQFYLSGQFVHYGESVDYIGGDEAMSYIERDKVSVSEMIKNLKQHMNITVKDTIFLHWLFPVRHLINGLRPLTDE